MFICDLCAAEFKKKSHIIVHIFNHGLYKCQYCPSRYKTKTRLISHAIKHTTAKPHACAHCDKRYKRINHLQDHMNMIHNIDHRNAGSTIGPGSIRSRSFVCNYCDKEFKTRSSIRKHLYHHYSDGEYVCDVCNNVYEHSKLFKEHTKSCNAAAGQADRYRCQHCDRTFLTKWRYDSHIVVHSSERRFACFQCDKRFKRKRGLKIHVDIVHGPKRATPKCTPPMKMHRQDERVDGEFPCIPCNKIFFHSKLFKNHGKVVHDPQRVAPECGNRSYKGIVRRCEICNATFQLQNRLRVHMVKHILVEKYIECPLCKKRFQIKSNLQKHMERHSFNKNIVLCVLCDEDLEQIVDQKLYIPEFGTLNYRYCM